MQGIAGGSEIERIDLRTMGFEKICKKLLEIRASGPKDRVSEEIYIKL